MEHPVIPAYSIDKDPDGIRARVVDAVVGALTLGTQGTNPPPAGHWLGPIWEMGRADGNRSAEFKKELDQLKDRANNAAKAFDSMLAAEASEGRAKGGFRPKPATQEHQRRVYAARDAMKTAVDAIRQSDISAPVLGPEWTPCRKLPVTVHVREQRPGETHVSTREGIATIKPDDLIMRGVEGEEYPIGRELWEKTYQVATTGQHEVIAHSYGGFSGVFYQENGRPANGQEIWDAATRAALDRTTQEPIAWADPKLLEWLKHPTVKQIGINTYLNPRKTGNDTMPLYTDPQPDRIKELEEDLEEADKELTRVRKLAAVDHIQLERELIEAQRIAAHTQALAAAAERLLSADMAETVLSAIATFQTGQKGGAF